MTTARITVTAHQFARIEAAWETCSYGNGRKTTGEWNKTFRQCVHEVLGYEPPEVFALSPVALPVGVCDADVDAAMEYLADVHNETQLYNALGQLRPAVVDAIATLGVGPALFAKARALAA